MSGEVMLNLHKIIDITQNIEGWKPAIYMKLKVLH